MPNKDIQSCAELVAQMVKDDRARDEIYAKIDDAIASRFEPSDEVKKLPFVKDRYFAMTNVADARNTGARTFSTLLPDIEIAPLDETEEEYQRTEMAEQVWAWEFERMNRVQSQKGFHDKLVEMAVTYHACAFQTEYLPYKFKGQNKDSRIKAILSRKNFNWPVHHPGTVHSNTNEYDQLQRVAKVVRMSAQELLDNFGGSVGAAKLKAKYAEKNKADLMKEQYTLVDFMDWKYRRKWAYPGTGDVVPSDVVFMDEEHNLPFIPWVVIDYGNPLWQSIIQSGLWDNFQYVNLLIFAKAVEQSTRSTLVIKTPDGTLQTVYIDFSNPSNIIVAQSADEITDLRPAPIDPQMSEIFQQMYNQVSASTVSSVLTNIGQYSDAPFSTVERIVQLALGQLSPAKKTAESGEAEGIYQGFQWIEHSELPLVGYRKTTADSQTGGNPRRRGEEIGIFPGNAPEEAAPNRVYFDLEQLYITVKLQANNVADEQSRLNLFINAKDRLGMSEKEAWERMGWKNYSLNQSHRLEELMLEQEIQLNFERERARIQVETQQAIQAMQAQIQQQQAAQQQQMDLQNQNQQMNSGTQFESLQGRDMRSGGQPAAQVAPLEGRVQVTGRTNGGEPTT